MTEEEQKEVRCPCCGYTVRRRTGACTACGEPEGTANADAERDHQAESEGRRSLLRTILILVVAAVAYRILVVGKLEQSAMLFIGIPALIAVPLALWPASKMMTGTIVRAICLGLCFSAILLGEGAACILFAALPAILIGLVIGFISDVKEARRKRGQPRGRSWAILPVPLLLLMSMEGTTPSLSFSRGESITAARTVHASAAEVQAALGRAPDFSRPLPLLLRIGFPVPVAAQGGGLTPGSTRIIRFAGGEGKPGDLTMRVSESQPGRVRYETLSDTSHIAHWLRWKSSTVTWTETSPGVCEVRWTVDYDRLLDPAWYFGPAERIAVKLAAGYLLETLALP